jgi:predicted dienelactone hydrolase
MVARIGRMLWKAVKVTLVAGPLVILLFLTVLWLEHNTTLELPAPTGPYAVGRLVTTWVDTGRADPFAPTQGERRELLVWIWYPAVRTERSTPADYLPRFWQEAPDEQGSWFLSTFLWRNPTKVRVHSFENAEVSSELAKLPVVVFRSGIGAAAVDYTTVTEDLASHGYIVVSADAPYSTWSMVMPDGRVIHKTDRGNPGDAPISETERSRLLDQLLDVWVADTRFMLDQLVRLNVDALSQKFFGRINLDATGIAGHSFGGATAAQVCHVDERCRAGIDLDGALRGSVAPEGVGRPFLFLLSDHAEASTPADDEISDAIHSAARRDPEGSLIVTLVGGNHFSFSDAPLIQSRILRSILVSLGGPGGGLDPRTGLTSTARYVREFFDVHLRGAPRTPLYSGPLVSGARLETK